MSVGRQTTFALCFNPASRFNPPAPHPPVYNSPKEQKDLGLPSATMLGTGAGDPPPLVTLEVVIQPFTRRTRLHLVNLDVPLVFTTLLCPVGLSHGHSYLVG